MTSITITQEIEVDIDLEEIESEVLEEALKARRRSISGIEVGSELVDQIYYALRDNDVDTLKRHSGTLVYAVSGRIV
jgi:DNA topoisomerase VI subunit B